MEEATEEEEDMVVFQEEEDLEVVVVDLVEVGKVKVEEEMVERVEMVAEQVGL